MLDVDEQSALSSEHCFSVTINDWAALSNLSEHMNKGYQVCTHCFDHIDNVYLKYC